MLIFHCAPLAKRDSIHNQSNQLFILNGRITMKAEHQVFSADLFILRNGGKITSNLPLILSTLNLSFKYLIEEISAYLL
ncbi:hypothetical protein O181_002618 [Austropuccinia psidii MF-1]|uniref:Uncharacterized protein n=1 Tax=Austropuccinia psidii MF-1 TaxID=1389203 RepID=A0A9Q3BCU7_9BASI|nr:hypothetical protein [Austropuccinia psidii MF-1]